MLLPLIQDGNFPDAEGVGLLYLAEGKRSKEPHEAADMLRRAIVLLADHPLAATAYLQLAMTHSECTETMRILREGLKFTEERLGFIHKQTREFLRHSAMFLPLLPNPDREKLDLLRQWDEQVEEVENLYTRAIERATIAGAPEARAILLSDMARVIEETLPHKRDRALKRYEEAVAAVNEYKDRLPASVAAEPLVRLAAFKLTSPKEDTLALVSSAIELLRGDEQSQAALFHQLLKAGCAVLGIHPRNVAL